MSSNQYVMEVENLTFRYPNRKPLLRGVNLKLVKGESVLIVGKSGSGKTTLARALIGIGETVYGGVVEGSIKLLGKNLDSLSHDELIKNVQLIGQNPYSHFVEHVVMDDIVGFLRRLYTREEAVKKVVSKAEELGMRDLLSRRFYELSGGEARRAAILKAVSIEPQLLILDEPLMWVDEQGVLKLLKLLSSLKKQGMSLLVFEQRFLPLLSISDKVYMLKNGTLKSVNKNSLRLVCESENPALKRDGNAVLEPRDQLEQGVRASRDVLIEVRNLWLKQGEKWLFKGLSLRINPSETNIIFGRNGSGKSTFLKILAGLVKQNKGSVKRACRRIAYLPQLPYMFFTEATIADEVRAVCSLSVAPGSCRSRVLGTLQALGIEDVEVPPFTLSWGQQTRLALALILISGVYDLALLDEPFTGLDYANRCYVAKLINEARSITKVITASSKDSLLCLNIDRAYLLENGTAIELPVEQVKMLEAGIPDFAMTLFG